MQNDSKVLGLDLATKTGWAVATRGRVVASGVEDFSKRRGESNGILFLRFRRWLDELIDLIGPDLVVYEQAHFRGGAATEICVGLQTHTQMIAAEHEIESAPVATSTLKKWATGSGRASKEEMIETSIRCLLEPRRITDDNEADAIHAAIWGLATFFSSNRRESRA